MFAQRIMYGRRQILFCLVALQLSLAANKFYYKSNFDFQFKMCGEWFPGNGKDVSLCNSAACFVDDINFSSLKCGTLVICQFSFLLLLVILSRAVKFCWQILSVYCILLILCHILLQMDLQVECTVRFCFTTDYLFGYHFYVDGTSKSVNLNDFSALS